MKGELETRKWQDSDGKDRYTTEIVASRVVYLNTKDKPTQREQVKEQADGGLLDQKYDVQVDANFADDDLPF